MPFEHGAERENSSSHDNNGRPRRRGRRYARPIDPNEDEVADPTNDLSKLAANLRVATIEPVQDIIAFDNQVDWDRVKALQELWGNRFLNDRSEVLKNRRRVLANFDKAEVVKLGNLFFHALFRPGGLQYVESLIRDYGSAPDQGPGPASFSVRYHPE
jgi:hypothetical protein